MTSVRKLEDEFNKLKEPNDLFIFELNEDNIDHIKLCQFILRKTRKEELKLYTTSKKISRVTGAELRDKKTGKKDEQ